jgi:hypothetical protein
MAAYVVNAGGAVHSVPDDWLEQLLASGYRLATTEEIAAWYAAQGLEVPGATTNDDEPDRGSAQPDRRHNRRAR